MIEQLEFYFKAEKIESLIFILVGVTSLLSSFFFYFNRNTKFWKGIAVPLFLISLIQITVGGTVYFRTDSQVMSLKKQIMSEPTVFKKEEISRMEKVIFYFKVYRSLEIFLIILGILLLWFGVYYVRPYYSGFGAGLTLQSLLMLVADYFAEGRAGIYIEQVRQFL